MRLFDGEMTCCRLNHHGKDICDKDRVPFGGGLGVLFGRVGLVEAFMLQRFSAGTVWESNVRVSILFKALQSMLNRPGVEEL